MVEYSIENFRDVLDRSGLLEGDVSEVHYAWGEEVSGEWSGGFSITLYNETNYLIIKDGEDFILETNSISPFHPEELAIDYYDSFPESLNSWLDEGCPNEY